MAGMFTMTTKDFKGLERFYRQSPKDFVHAGRSVLNSFAFGTKKETEIEVNRRMTVRNPGFVKSSIRVNMARGSSLQYMFSEAYTTRRGSFTGWTEQETGRRTSLNRSISKAARGGTWSGKVPKRYKRNAEFFDPERYSGRSYEHRVLKMMGAMRGSGRSIKKRPFIITKSMKGRMSSYKKGIYGWQGNRVKLIQNFEKKTQPKRIPIMKNARLNYFRKTNIINVWGREIDRILSRYR